jgi:uncharacterized membrane protein
MIKRRFKLEAAIVISMCLPLLSCGASTLGDAEIDVVEVDQKTPDFRQIGLLMALKCQPCHAENPGKFAPKGTPVILLDDEDEFNKFAFATRRRVFNDPERPMPPEWGTPLADSEKAGLLKYITAIEERFKDEKTVETTLLFADVSTTLTQRCGVCHSSAAKRSPPTLDDLEDYRSSRLEVLQSIENGSMPKNETGFATSEDGKKIVEWLRGGNDLFD